MIHPGGDIPLKISANSPHHHESQIHGKDGVLLEELSKPNNGIHPVNNTKFYKPTTWLLAECNNGKIVRTFLCTKFKFFFRFSETVTRLHLYN